MPFPNRIDRHRNRTRIRPSREQELLLRAALSTGESAVTAWRQWRSLVNPDLHHLDADSFRLVPLLYHNLASLGVTDPIMDRFKGIFRRTWYQNQTLLRACAELLEAMQSAGLEVLVLDGLFLTVKYHRTLGLRPLESVHVLVRDAQAEKAIQILASMDWKASHLSTVKPIQVPLEITHVRSFSEASSLSCVLHRRLKFGQSAACGNDIYWEASESLDVRGIRTRSLCATDQFLRTCVQSVGWSWLPRIRWVADAVAILREDGARIDWERLISLAKRHQVILGTRSALSYLRDQLDAPIPDEVMERIGILPVSDLERRTFAAAFRRNRLIGFLEHSWLQYRAYGAEYGKKRLLADVTGFLDHLRMKHGHDSRWRVLWWAVSTSVHGMRSGCHRNPFL